MTDPVTKRDLVEQNIGKVFQHPSAVPVSQNTGGLAYQTMNDIIEAAKMMSMAGPMIPPWLRGNPGSCWAIIHQANQWSFDPVTVAKMSYCVVSDGVETVAYMSQLIHALIEARAPIKNRLRFRFEGDGEKLTCTVTAHVRGENEPIELTTPPISQITPKRSPLWRSDPRQQLSYYAARAMCRRHFPDVLMGVYDRDEIEGEVIDHPGGRARDVTPPNNEAMNELQERLRASVAAVDAEREGFAPDVVANGLADPVNVPIDDAPPIEQPPSAPRRGRPKKLPSTPKQYREHVANWLGECTTEQSIEERWRIEMRLRNNCGVTADEKADIRILVDQRIAELRA